MSDREVTVAELRDLVRRFVEHMFSDEYLSTVGVKVDRKVVSLDENDVTLLVWDIHGEHGTLKVLPQYLVGSSAFLVVVDATRPDETAVVASTILDRNESDQGPVPYVIALNKADLIDDWTMADSAIVDLLAGAVAVVRTSAKTGEKVEDAFTHLAQVAVG